jgi:drug/metabolite transporter (DMT)-like permease
LNIRSLTPESKFYLIAVLGAFFVTFLWSTSFVIIKIGLKTATPMLFSGFRYLLASVILLLIVFFNKKSRNEFKSLKREQVIILFVYGIIFISLTQGFQYLSLNLLPAITVSQLLTITPVIVLLLSNFLLKEIPSKLDVILLVTTLLGVSLFYYPFQIPLSQILGLFFLIICLISNASSTILGRYINSTLEKNSLTITAVSMFFGGLILTISGFLFETFSFSATEVFYVVFLAIVNTAFTFTIWNKAMKTLRALDISLINNTMLPQITILSIIFLAETVTPLEFFSLVIVLVSVVLIQIHSIIKQNNKRKVNATPLTTLS